MALLESVPNVSEGRDPAVVAAIANAFASAGARVLDKHVDPDHHRAVVTLVGSERALEDGLVAGIAESSRLIDLRRHVGVHPRIGSADVVPVVPLVEVDVPRAIAVASAVGRRVGAELGIPVLLYGELGRGRRPAFYRRGGSRELQRRIEAAELTPDFGPPRLHHRAGAVIVGVRAPLVAYNVALDGTLETAKDVASAVRESSGGLPGVQALGLLLGDGSVQVSTNVIDLQLTAPHLLVDRIVAEAASRHAGVGAGELVGLIPAASVAAAAAAAGIARPLESDGVPTADALTAAARALRLDRLEPERVLEWHLVER